ncbi:MAG: hypothetical protein WDW38_006418 [Sanguina aurantia]
MHPLILFDANEPEQMERADVLGGKILELCVEVGGTITGEHGVGREKINQMCVQFNHDELNVFHALKAAFDPERLLNPGKNIPTLNRCAEFGLMHVSHGKLPERLVDHVGRALASRTPLRIRGGDSKAFLGRAVQGEEIDTRSHHGIVDYDPTELVVTVRAGTSLAYLNAALDAKGQMLPCEPPSFGDRATVGGMMASALAGPRRPWSGSVRDFVLGCRVITGAAKHLRFGGQVMKNVAGYDMSRLLAGSFGCLGVITEVSLKVLPKPRAQRCLALAIDAAEGRRELIAWQRAALPITGACWVDGALHIRLEGGAGSVDAAADRLGGNTIEPAFWDDLREHRLPFFQDPRPLWRLSVPVNALLPELPGEVIVDWAGAQRWLKSDASADVIRALAHTAGGHATCFTPASGHEPFHPLAEALLHYQQQLKPEQIIRSCVHCGFCNATCPTYQILGNELDGPRGRIYLIKQLLEGEPVTEKTQLHLDRCLSCRNCETTCPSGVKYHSLLDIGREELERRVERPLGERALRTGLRQVIPNPAVFSALLKTGQLFRPLLPDALKKKIPSSTTAPKPRPATQHARYVLMLEGCVQQSLSPNTNAATARVLDRLGISIENAPTAGCCGATDYHLNAQAAGLDRARRNIDAWWPSIEAGAESIVQTASGCGAFVKEYGHLLRDDALYADKARRVSAMARDIVELLADEPLAALPIKQTSRIAFHCPCTLQHGARSAPAQQGNTPTGLS